MTDRINTACTNYKFIIQGFVDFFVTQGRKRNYWMQNERLGRLKLFIGLSSGNSIREWQSYVRGLLGRMVKANSNTCACDKEFPRYYPC